MPIEAKLRRVILESPYRGDTSADQAKNTRYARACLKHSLTLGEAPIASHLLYTQVLRDSDPTDRNLGITAGLSWFVGAEAAVFYTDRGLSEGMKAALDFYVHWGVPVEMRSLYGSGRQRQGGKSGAGQTIREIPAISAPEPPPVPRPISGPSFRSARPFPPQAYNPQGGATDPKPPAEK